MYVKRRVLPRTKLSMPIRSPENKVVKVMVMRVKIFVKTRKAAAGVCVYVGGSRRSNYER